VPIFSPSQLKTLAAQILTAAGALAEEADIVAGALVDANLAGFDSHGVLRVPEYVGWMEQGLVTPGARLTIARESPAFAAIDGGWGWGQVIGRQAMEIAIRKASEVGVGTVFGSRCCHLGKVGDYPLMAAERGMAAVMFVNTHGGGKLVAPWGGRERRLSANPIAIGIPRRSGPPILLDISTSAIAEGRIRNMLHRGVPVPAGCIMDADGNPTTDAAQFYGPPAGALYPFGGHKGYGLSLATDILAGALSGGGCSRPDTTRVANAFTAIVMAPELIRSSDAFEADVDGLIAWVKSSQLAPGFDEILAPGEPDARERARRERDGISLDETIWQQIGQVARKYGVALPD
jgi:uncharacterized oxidoreductase